MPLKQAAVLWPAGQHQIATGNSSVCVCVHVLQVETFNFYWLQREWVKLRPAAGSRHH